MEKSTKYEAEAARFRQDIRSLLRTRVREAIEITLQEELAEALGCDRYERSGERRGYRNGSQERRITTAYGPKDLEIPRGRLVSEDGSSEPDVTNSGCSSGSLVTSGSDPSPSLWK